MTSLLPARVYIVAMSAQGAGLSGGDRIFIELARRWSSHGQPVSVIVTTEGKAMCARNGLDSTVVTEWALRHPRKRRFTQYFSLTMHTLRHVAVWGVFPSGSIVYSASDFWPDTLAGLLAKFRHRATWIAAFYMFAPPPHRGFEGQWRKGLPRLADVFYWLSQRLTLPLITHFADIIFVTGEHDKERFCDRGVSPSRVIVVRGGVDVGQADAVTPGPGPGYDGVFIGRLHVQKGVAQLIEIWSKVQKRRPGARLAIIGDGPESDKLRELRDSYGLNEYIDFFGFLDGEAKFAVVKKSLVVVHPSLYDSGGMAACEAFACGLPGVCFDLPELRTYYPQGMKKTPPPMTSIRSPTLSCH